LRIATHLRAVCYCYWYCYWYCLWTQLIDVEIERPEVKSLLLVSGEEQKNSWWDGWMCLRMQCYESWRRRLALGKCNPCRLRQPVYGTALGEKACCTSARRLGSRLDCQLVGIQFFKRLFRQSYLAHFNHAGNFLRASFIIGPFSVWINYVLL
jgi:hypothetical protein